MKLTKQYLRFIPAGKFNIICSSKCNVSFIKHNDKDNRYVAVGAAEDVIIWDSRLAKKVNVFEGEKHECVFLAACPQTQKIVAGYSDGTVIIYDPNSEENAVFSGHRSPITSISFDNDGHRIATGSKDTDVVVWDIVAESGLFRLSGHKGSITRVRFMNTRNILVSSSKDTLIKFWDLANGHCFKTLTGHVTEIWDFCLMRNDSYLVTGTNDSELRVWRINDSSTIVQSIDYKEDSIDYGSPITCEKVGSILRQGLGRVVSMSCDRSSQILCCHGNEKLVELFNFLSEEEALRRYNKKQKKLRKKQRSLENEEPMDVDIPPPTSLKFSVSRLAAIKTEAKVKYVDIWFDGIKIKTVSSLNNNCLEFHSVTLENTKESFQEKVLTKSGHNSDVRTLAFGYDNAGIVSGSGTGIKVWNRETLSCLRTIETDYVLSICFVPGDRYVLAGLKNGSLLIVDIASGDVIETIEAHTKELWRVSILPSKLGCITAGGDCSVKIWNLELLKSNHSDGSNVLTLIHLKTLLLEDAVLDVCVSPDSNLIATALLDSTVKIFFMDSLKFFLCLYGHKLPITCLDISYDSTLIATGSADRNVKIWGLDYGDCHKSLFAHEDTVTSLKFVPNSHYFFTCGKDGKLKQWDADNFERILTIDAHHGEAWNLAVSPNGHHVVSCGQDRVIRMFEKSYEPLVLEDERETEREKEEEATLATGSESVIQGRAALLLASKKTVTAEKGAELLLECMDVLKEYRKDVLQCQRASKDPPPLPQIMIAFNAKTDTEYFLTILRKIRTSDFEEILSLLSLSSVCELFELLLPLLQTLNNETETVVKILVFLLRAHHKPIVSSGNLFLLLRKLQTAAVEKINELRDIVGCNLHGLLYLQREM